VFGTGVAIAGYLSHNFLIRSAREQVLEQARLMMGAAGGMRTSTLPSKSVRCAKRIRCAAIVFLPHTVPAYSATEVFNYLLATYPDYSYFDLLRGHVIKSSQRAASQGQSRIADQARNSNIRDLHSISPADQDVGRLHVAMQNSAIVGLTERVQCLADVVDRLRNPQFFPV